MGYEVFIRWMLMVWVVRGRRHVGAQRPVSEIEATRRIPAGQNEYLPSMLVSIADSLQWLMSESRRLRKKGRERNFLSMASYPDNLLRFQAGRLAVS
jgi:hypothetical protein